MKKRFGQNNKSPVGKGVKRLKNVNTKRPIDARTKIAQKTREKITDARVLLTKKQRQGPNRANLLKTGLQTRKNRAKQMQIEEDDDDMMFAEKINFSGPAPVLRRTVKNNYVLPRTLATMPPLPTFTRTAAIESDPFDCYQPYERRPPVYATAEPIPVPMDEYFDEPSPRKGILRVNKANYMTNSPPPQVSNALKARLYSKPDPRTPSGIFGRDRDPDKEYQKVTEKQSSNGYRIVVSNLHTSVSQSDIQELFEDIGPLIDSRLVRPGVAEVIYERLQDAETAVESYHNRQLDGQPMKCLLVRPRNATIVRKTTALDMDTVHKVLFKR